MHILDYIERYTGRVVQNVALTSSTNSAITISVAAVAGHRHILMAVTWSYSGTPTGGRLTTTGLTGDELDIDIPAGGPGPWILPPLVGDVFGAVGVTLAAGGGGIVGKLNCQVLTIPFLS